jgi:hypothetical protein
MDTLKIKLVIFVVTDGSLCVDFDMILPHWGEYYKENYILYEILK